MLNEQLPVSTPESRPALQVFYAFVHLRAGVLAINAVEEKHFRLLEPDPCRGLLCKGANDPKGGRRLRRLTHSHGPVFTEITVGCPQTSSKTQCLGPFLGCFARSMVIWKALTQCFYLRYKPSVQERAPFLWGSREIPLFAGVCQLRQASFPIAFPASFPVAFLPSFPAALPACFVSNWARLHGTGSRT